jgi:hypothetical protein
MDDKEVLGRINELARLGPGRFVGQPLGTVKSWAREAMNRLRQALREEHNP